MPQLPITMNNRIPLGTALILLLTVVPASMLWAGDWPAYRHDLARSGVTDDTLPTILHSQWIYRSAHAPRPAWPEPGRELNRMAFDYAYEVVASSQMAYFGSSVDHKVYALDLATGRTRWTFYTEGPIRFAPTLEAGRLFVGSDDGHVYCLSADDGRLIWKCRGGPKNDLMFGNQQLMSRWPIRSGVAVDKGLVYFAAGMWPNEGVFFYALRATDGHVIWLNDTSGIGYMPQPHPPSYSVTGVSPQGYIVGTSQYLFLPTGRSVAAAYDRNQGKLLYYHSRPTTWGDRWGGSWNMVAGDLLLSWRCHVGADIDIMPGEYQPDANDGIVAFDLKTGSVKRDFRGKLQAVLSDNTLYMSGSGKITAYDFSQWKSGATLAKCTKWETPHGRAYTLILAGNTLVVGGRDAVTTINAKTGKSLWRDKTDGQVRSLAVAESSLLVSTTSGRIICYTGKPISKASIISPGVAASASSQSGASKSARSILKNAGKNTGYCLVLGDLDCPLLQQLAAQSELTIYALENDPQKVAAVRKFLDQAHLLGTRVVVNKGRLETVAYPDFFADLIVLDGDSENGKHLEAKSVYRLLRPYGGTILFSGPKSKDGSKAIVKWLADAGLPPEEIRVTENRVQVVRGKLPGAGDWTHQYGSAAKTGSSTESRARVPLKLLWFGEPGPAQLISRHWKGPAPLCINGRMFVTGQHVLYAVDPYNGRQIWRRNIAKVGRFPVLTTGANVVADANSVYVVLDNQCLRLDAATGKTVQTYQLPPLSESQPNPPSLKWGYVAIGPEGLLGTIGTTRQSQAIFMLAPDGSIRWLQRLEGIVGHNAISMDDQRVYFIEQTDPAVVTRARKRGESLPAIHRLISLDAKTGKQLWKTEKGVAGRTDLWNSNGVLLATGQGQMAGYKTATGAMLYKRTVPMRRSPVIIGDTIYGEPIAYDLRTGATKSRKNPLSGTSTPWDFNRSYGCGSISGAQNMLLFRSSTLGIDDLACDTGVHNFGGVRAGCFINAIAAGGLVLMPTSDAGCTCSYCYQTTVALTPTDKHENWSIFFERLPKASVHHAALNVGAPGDQRDAEGQLWIAAPRPDTVGRRDDIAIPFRLRTRETPSFYRTNTDLVTITETDRPWIYGSGIRGSLRAELDLNVLDRGVTAWPTTTWLAPNAPDEASLFDTYKAVPATGRGSSATVRYDDKNLYVNYQRPARKETSGRPVPWSKSVSGDDASVWNDDSFELYLSNTPPGKDQPSRRYLHVGVSASGARYAANWIYETPPLPERGIPQVDVTIDGKPEDWKDQGLRVVSLPGRGGKLRSASNLDATIQVGWNRKGIVLLARIKDSSVHPAAGKQALSDGDCVELFVAPHRGIDDGYHVVVAPDAAAGSTKHRVQVADYRKKASGELDVQVGTQRTRTGYDVEISLPWKTLNIQPKLGQSLAMQLFVNDSDAQGQKYQFQALWHPAGNPRRDPFAYQVFRLTDKRAESLVFVRGKKDRSGTYDAKPPQGFPLSLPTLGANPESTQFSAEWTSTVRADSTAMTAKLAIPWATIQKAGLDREHLMLNMTETGPLIMAPVLGRNFERLLIIPASLAKSKTVSVRLHFAELTDVQPGQRVFDIKLQNRVVLRDFDVVKQAGGKNRAIVKQFDGIRAAGAVIIQLVPKSPQTGSRSEPILSGVELITAK